jgi:hypothetical protein
MVSRGEGGERRREGRGREGKGREGNGGEVRRNEGKGLTVSPNFISFQDCLSKISENSSVSSRVCFSLNVGVAKSCSTDSSRRSSGCPPAGPPPPEPRIFVSEFSLESDNFCFFRGLKFESRPNQMSWRA